MEKSRSSLQHIKSSVSNSGLAGTKLKFLGRNPSIYRLTVHPLVSISLKIIQAHHEFAAEIPKGNLKRVAGILARFRY